MQRLVLILAVVAVAILASVPAQAARKGAKCTDNAACKTARASAVNKRNDPNYEPTIERDGFVVHRRNDADPNSGGGGY